MILLRASVGKKLLITYLSSICLAWKSVSHMRFNSSSQDAFAPWALGLPQRCQICSLPEMRGSSAVEREAKELPQPGHGDQKKGSGTLGTVWSGRVYGPFQNTFTRAFISLLSLNTVLGRTLRWFPYNTLLPGHPKDYCPH